jgi:hypothetical protein
VHKRQNVDDTEEDNVVTETNDTETNIKASSYEKKRSRNRRRHNHEKTREKTIEIADVPAASSEDSPARHIELNGKDSSANSDEGGNQEIVVVSEIDFSEEQKELAKFAKTYRELEQELWHLTSALQENSTNKKNKKGGWWQKLIKKPDDGDV